MAAKFGKSLRFSGGYASIAPSAVFRLLASPLTIDLWVQADDPGRCRPLCFYLDADNYLAIERVATRGGLVRLGATYRRAGEVVLRVTGGYRDYSIFRHVALVREGSVLRLFENGIAADAHEVSEPLSLDFSGHVLYLGRSIDRSRPGELAPHFGHLDEIRIQKEAAWTLGFSAPAAPYSRTRRAGFAERANVAAPRRASFAEDASVASHQRRSAFAEAADVVPPRSAGFAERADAGTAARAAGFAETSDVALSARRAGFAETSGVVMVRRCGFAEKSAVHSGSYAAGFGERSDVIRTARAGYAEVADVRSLRRSSFSERANVEDTALERYEVYRGIGDGAVDYSVPIATAASFPIVTPVLGEGLKHRLVVRRRSKYNLLSQNVAEYVIETGLGGEQVTPRPLPVAWFTAAISAGGDPHTVRVQAIYFYWMDDNEADEFVIYHKAGVETVPLGGVSYWPDDGSSPASVSVPMSKSGGVALLDVEIEDAGSVAVKTRRSADGSLSADNPAYATLLVAGTATKLAAVDPENVAVLLGG